MQIAAQRFGFNKFVCIKSILLVLFCFMLLSNRAIAEGGCAEGHVQVPSSSGGVMCIQDTNAASAPAQPRGRWETRWGAIATDGLRAVTGTVVNVKSKRQAVKMAMSQCRAKGGKSCKAILSYYNQCAVIVSGDKQHTAISAATINEASKMGINECTPIDTNCQVKYAECSPPVWIQ